MLTNIFNSKTPWENRKSIYAHIKNNIGENGELTTESLPDDEIINKPNELQWAAGALDGLLGHHAAASQDNLALAKLIQSISLFGGKKDKIKCYNIIIKDNAFSSMNNVIEELVRLEVKITQNLYDWVEFLAFQSPDRNAVKMGIVLIGAISATQLKDQIKILGLHEEFTGCVARALQKISETPEIDLWELAKQVHGWGRIELVESLEKTENPEIKYWILTKGYKNTVLYEYLAYIAADTGELKEALSKDSVEEDILLAASDIIQSLFSEGPALGISIYKDARQAIELYIKHTLGKRNNIYYLLTYDCIYSYVTDDDIEWAEVIQNGWSEEKRAEIAKLLGEEIKNNEWKEQVINRADTENDNEFSIINRAAKILNIDFFNIHWERMKKKPLCDIRWYNLISSTTSKNIDDVLEYAVKNIPLEKISTGADNLLGLGKEFNLHGIIDFILQELGKYAGKGEAIILAALKSPVIRNRHIAIKALEDWEISYISQELKAAIKAAEKLEPQKDIKERLECLIAKFN